VRAQDTQVFKNISATTAAFLLKGGRYGVDVIATFGGGSVILNRVAGDNSTVLPCPNIAGVATGFTAAGYQAFDLPPGSYKLVITTATAVYASVSRVPGE
jgi:hypothetical protein